MIIQRLLRQALVNRRRLFSYLLAEWEGCEHFLFAEKSRANRGSRGSAFNIKSRVPFDVKMKYLRQKLKCLITNYIVKLRNYSTVKLLYKESMKGVTEKSLFLGENKANRPPVLNIREEFTDEVFGEMIHSALRERLNWRRSILITKP